jgi:hypothetical protein
MRPSLFPSDDALPTWLHTTLLFLIVSPFAGFLLLHGLGALATGILEPLNGPDAGQFFFGPETLHGGAARLAGVSLLSLGGAFIAVALRFSRLGFPRVPVRFILPWALLAISVGLSFAVNSSR